MAEPVVSMALGILRDLLEEEVRFLLGVSREVKALQTQLEEMKCLLEDADKRKFESKTVSSWISKIRDLVYRAEDVIETYAFNIASRRRGGYLKQILRRFACALEEGSTTHQIGTEISQIKSELATVTKSMQDYGIRSIIHGESSTNPIDDENQKWKRMTSPLQSDDCFVGKDQEVKSLVSLLVEDEQQRLITIWGMGGIGKTTIVRKVYNHKDVKRSIESFAWVCITQKCRIRSVLEDVLKQLNPSVADQITTFSDNDLIQNLSQVQRNKRCIVVLDDLWELNHWNGLKHGFLIEGSSSKVMVTTRIKDVAEKGYIKEIGLLNDEDGWTLLKAKAFAKNNIISDMVKERETIEEIGKRMVKKCGNLPMAISLLGGVLQQKTSVEQWKSIEMNINTSLHSESESEIKEVLDLSFDELPHHLRPCFLYMGLVLKEDESIFGADLYNMWIAQGMVSYDDKGKKNTLMDIAECYMSELVSRCLVEFELREMTEDDRYGGHFKLHDMVWKLCLSNGRKEEFGVHSWDYQGGNFDSLWDESSPSIKVRHLAINFQQNIDAEHPRCMSMNDVRHIHSLLLVNKTTSDEPIGIPMSAFEIHEFKLLKVLFFSKISFKGGKLLRKIGNLIHLRELCLKECELDELPSSICNLRYLIILDLEGSEIVKMPSNLKYLSRLKHLTLPTFDIEICKYNHISLEGLDKLEILVGFDSRMSNFKSLLSMKNLRVLSGQVHDSGTLSSILDAMTHHWKSLHQLGLQIEGDCEFTLQETEGLMILQKLFTCPPLKSLSLWTQIGASLPEECKTQMLASSIVTLILSGCRIEKDPMAMLGQIPSLKCLLMMGDSFIGDDMMCPESSFPKLKILALIGLPNLKEWKVEQGAMPLLSRVLISHCLKLVMLPVGFRFLNLLDVLAIKGMAEMGRRVSEEGEDYDKVSHVPSILIED